MNIDKLIPNLDALCETTRFSPLMNIDKLILARSSLAAASCFSPLMNIDKLIPQIYLQNAKNVLVL